MVEEQLILNAAMLQDNNGVRQDIRCCLENRQKAEPIVMDVGASRRGKGKASRPEGPDVCKNWPQRSLGGSPAHMA